MSRSLPSLGAERGGVTTAFSKQPVPSAQEGPRTQDAGPSHPPPSLEDLEEDTERPNAAFCDSARLYCPIRKRTTCP